MIILRMYGKIEDNIGIKDYIEDTDGHRGNVTKVYCVKNKAYAVTVDQGDVININDICFWERWDGNASKRR